VAKFDRFYFREEQEEVTIPTIERCNEGMRLLKPLRALHPTMEACYGLFLVIRGYSLAANARMTALFRRYDRNGDGVIDAEEFEQVQRDLAGVG